MKAAAQRPSNETAATARLIIMALELLKEIRGEGEAVGAGEAADAGTGAVSAANLAMSSSY